MEGSAMNIDENMTLDFVQPYLNSKNEVTEAVFNDLFGSLSRKEQYQVVDILVKNRIEILYADAEITKIEAEKIDIRKNFDKEAKKEAFEMEKRVTSGSLSDKEYQSLRKMTNEQLCAMYQKGDEKALTALLKKNIRFIFLVAHTEAVRHRQNGLDDEDILQEGMAGAIQGARRFDPTSDYSFTTYSWYWIKQRVSRAICDCGSLIRLPVHMHEKLAKVRRIRAKYPEASEKQLYHYYLEDQDIVESENSWKDFQKLLFYLETYSNTTSLNMPVGEKGDTELENFIEDKDAISVEDLVLSDARKDDLISTMEKVLNKREMEVLKERYGFEDGNPKTLEKVGEHFGVTRERIRQIERKALEKLGKSHVIRDWEAE